MQWPEWIRPLVPGQALEKACEVRAWWEIKSGRKVLRKFNDTVGVNNVARAVEEWDVLVPALV